MIDQNEQVTERIFERSLPTRDEMPFLEHLEELRKRLFWVAGSNFVGFIVAFLILGPIDFFSFVQIPVRRIDPLAELVVRRYQDPFMMKLTASLILGGLLASPVTLFQVWSFLAPGLHRHEKRVIIPVMSAGVILFLAGAALCFFVVLPTTLSFFLDQNGGAFRILPDAYDYFSLVFTMSMAFGLMFEMPIVVLALSTLGVVKPRMLSKYRKYAVVILLVLSAVVTPDANPATLLMLFVPLYVLYEISLVIAVILEKRRTRT